MVLFLMTVMSCKAKTPTIETQASYLVKNNEEVYATLPKLKPGDKLIFEDGDYKDLKLVVNESGIAEKMITIMAKNPGKVFITGDAKVELRGEYILFKGFYFKNGNRNFNEWASHGPGIIALYGSHNRVTECVFNDFDQVNSAYITTSLNTDKTVPKHCRIDHCVFVGKKTLDQVINLNNRLKETNDGSNIGPAMYHRIDHCFFSNPPKVGNAGGGIRIGYSRYDVGRCLVDSNLFQRQDSEAEIVTSKSQENVYYANTIINSQGTLNFRHGDKQVALNNFYISTDDKFGYGGMFIWGSKHIIANNYFSLQKTIASRGNAALYFNPGIKDSEHALAFDILAVNNIFKNNNGYAINFEPLFERRTEGVSNSELPNYRPYNITLNGNLFITTEKTSFDLFLGDIAKQSFENNYSYGISKNNPTNIQPLAINNTGSPDFYQPQSIAGYSQSKVAKIDNIEGINLNIQDIINGGIKGKPLTWDDVRPKWLADIPNDYWRTGE